VSQPTECRQKLRRAAAGPDGLRMEVFMVNEFVCIRASCFIRLFVSCCYVSEEFYQISAVKLVFSVRLD